MRNFHGVHSTVIIGENVILGHDVTIGAYTIVYDNVSLGSGTVVGPNCILGEPLAEIYEFPSSYENPVLSIGNDSIIRSGTTIYAGTDIGGSFECGHGVTIREAARIGQNVRVGTLSDVQGHCEIGDYVRLHSNVHIGHRSVINDYVWIFPYVVLTNDPHPPSNILLGVTIEEFAVIATMSVILPGVKVGKDSLVGACSLVRNDVPAEAVVVGNPAKQVASIHDIKSRLDGSNVYPWREAFDRGMPWQGIGFHAWKTARNTAHGKDM